MTEEELKVAQEQLEKDKAGVTELLNKADSLIVVAETQSVTWDDLIARMERRVKQFNWFVVGAAILFIAMEIIQLVLILKTRGPGTLAAAHVLLIAWWGYMGFTSFKKT